MKYEIENDAGTTVLRVSGEMTVSDRGAFDAMIPRVVQGGSRNVVVDMKNLEFMDSAGLGMLLTLRDQAQGSGVSVRLRGPEGDVREMLDLDDEEYARIRGQELAMIFQDPMSALNPERTVGYQIIEVLKINENRPANHVTLQKRATNLLQQVGIPDPEIFLKSYPHELSGGLNQRAMIAMMLANDPRLLIADEPTTALDVTVQAQILKLLVSLRQERGMSIVIITHNLGVVAETCDRVFVMYCGRTVESGPVREIFRAPRHPYTYGLLGALPRIDRPPEELKSIQDQAPMPHALPPGCAFAPRCPKATEACTLSVPPLSGDHRQVACINPINAQKEDRVS